MKLRLALAALAVALTSVIIVAPVGAQTTTSGITLPTTNCTLSAVLGGGNCSVQLTGLQNIAGQPNAVLNLLNSAGNVVSTVTVPLQGILQASGTCSILDLNIGPIHLDLLGLVVDTNAIHLQITAQPGSGNLLGNLLCSVAHLLDNPSQQLAGVINLINNLLRQGGTLTAVP